MSTEPQATNKKGALDARQSSERWDGIGLCRKSHHLDTLLLSWGAPWRRDGSVVDSTCYEPRRSGLVLLSRLSEQT